MYISQNQGVNREHNRRLKEKKGDTREPRSKHISGEEQRDAKRNFPP